ncbi:MAG: hypothetical protein LBU60_04030 [Clostridiales bacterium]|jgi:hypothetical protein|nr:hypothetical protein [Clostridiales bacterium]
MFRKVKSVIIFKFVLSLLVTVLFIGTLGSVLMSFSNTHSRSMFARDQDSDWVDVAIDKTERGNWIDIVYGNGLYVAIGGVDDIGLVVSTKGYIMISADGKNWTESNSPFDSGWKSIAYSQELNLFVVVGFYTVDLSGLNPDDPDLEYGEVQLHSQIIVSNDGITWSEVNPPNNQFMFSNVVYGNGKFLALGMGETSSLTSQDGIHWEEHKFEDRTVNGKDDINYYYFETVTFGNNLFVAFAWFNPDVFGAKDANGEQCYTSTDGIVWTNHALKNDKDVDIDGFWINVIYNGKIFLAVADYEDLGFDVGEQSIILASKNGTDWVRQTQFSSNKFVIATVVSDNTGKFLITALDENEKFIIMTSTDNDASAGVAWDTTDPKDYEDVIKGYYDVMIFADGKYIAFSVDSEVGAIISQDGVDWEGFETPRVLQNIFSGIAYGNGLFVAVSSSGNAQIMTSPDGIVWTEQKSPVSKTSWHGVTYGGGQFVAVGGAKAESDDDKESDCVMTSPDGINWTAQKATANIAWSSVAYGNDMYVAVGYTDDRKGIMYSYDAIKWNIVTDNGGQNSPGIHYWTSVTFGGGLFVAVSDWGVRRVVTSSNGIDWTLTSGPYDEQAWQSVTYGIGPNGKGIFVAVGVWGGQNTNGAVMTSQNGKTGWTLRPTPNLEWIDVTYGNNMFVAVTNVGKNRVMVSRDGIKWTEQKAPGQGTWNRIVSGLNPNGEQIFVAAQGVTEYLWTHQTPNSFMVTSNIVGTPPSIVLSPLQIVLYFVAPAILVLSIGAVVFVLISKRKKSAK